VLFLLEFIEGGDEGLHEITVVSQTALWYRIYLPRTDGGKNENTGEVLTTVATI